VNEMSDQIRAVVFVVIALVIPVSYTHLHTLATARSADVFHAGWILRSGCWCVDLYRPASVAGIRATDLSR